MGLKSDTPRQPGYQPIYNDCSFVSSDGPRKSNDREVQRKIRANAMRDYWRRKRLETQNVPDHSSTQSRSVNLESSPRDLGFEHLERIWWRDTRQPKPPSGLAEASLEAKDCIPRHAERNLRAECHLLPLRPATQKAFATHPQRRDTGKKLNREGVSLNESCVTDLSIRVGTNVADPFNASALGGNRQNSFLLSHRKYPLSYAMPKIGQEYALQGYDINRG